MKFRFILNGAETTVECDPMRRLLDVLREDLNLTASKEGCGEGECGACSVLLNGKNVNSCLIPISAVEGEEIVTIEGLRNSEEFKLISNCFAEAGAVQCGFCTPGMIISTVALLRKNAKPTRYEIREWLSGNLCRCTGMNMIIEAVQMASVKGGLIWR
ncbi:(2Fe-2S)-binding protein [bacterium]|nr:(2Fe-2S)-binding protein [bacterium]